MILITNFGLLTTEDKGSHDYMDERSLILEKRSNHYDFIQFLSKFLIKFKIVLAHKWIINEITDLKENLLNHHE